MKATVGTTTTVYVGNYYEFTSVGTPLSRTYYYAGSQRLAVRERTAGGNGTLYFLAGDHLGSTSIVATSGGAWYSELRYDAWGETRYSNGVTPTDFRYTGQKQTSSSGSLDWLYFYNARWVDVQAQRFLQADTLIPDAGSGQGFNRYAYANNSPVRYNDPSGHCAGTPASNPDCWKELNSIEKEYGIDIDTENIGKTAFCEGRGEKVTMCFSPRPWELADLNSLRSSLRAMRQVLGDNVFRNALSGVVFRLQDEVDSADDLGVYSKFKTDSITLDKRVITVKGGKYGGGMGTIVHEMWHGVADWADRNRIYEGGLIETYREKFNLRAGCTNTTCLHDERPWEDFAIEGTSYVLGTYPLVHDDNLEAYRPTFMSDRYKFFQQLTIDLGTWVINNR